VAACSRRPRHRCDAAERPRHERRFGRLHRWVGDRGRETAAKVAGASKL